MFVTMLFFKLKKPWKNKNPQRHIFIPLYLGIDQTKFNLKMSTKNLKDDLWNLKLLQLNWVQWIIVTKILDLIPMPKQKTTRFNSNVNFNKIKNLWSINSIKIINLLTHTQNSKPINISLSLWSIFEMVWLFKNQTKN